MLTIFPPPPLIPPPPTPSCNDTVPKRPWQVGPRYPDGTPYRLGAMKGSMEHYKVTHTPGMGSTWKEFIIIER